MGLFVEIRFTESEGWVPAINRNPTASTFETPEQVQQAVPKAILGMGTSFRVTDTETKSRLAEGNIPKDGLAAFALLIKHALFKGKDP